MAPKGTKRTSSAAGRPAKKAKGDEVAEKCAEVATALDLAQQKEVPADVITLLAGALPHSLTLYKEERHAFQTSVIEMVERTLQKSQEALESDLAAAQAFVSNGDAAKEERAAAVTSITARLQECQETHSKKVTERAEQLEVTKTTEKELKATLAAQKDGDKEATAVESNKAALDNALKIFLAPLKEAAGKGKQIPHLQKALKGAGVEDSLVSAIELSLSKKPEARGIFDGVILEQLDLQVNAKIAAFDAKLQEAAPAREARSAAVKGAQDAHDAAEAASKAAADELKAAKEAEATAKEDLAAAKESAKNLTAELLEAAQKLDKATAALEAFRSGALVAFADLRERSAPAEPVAEAEAPATEAHATEAPAPEVAAA